MEFGLLGTNHEEGPAPRQSSFAKGHYDHPDRSNVRVKGWEHLSLERQRGFLMHKSLLTEHVWIRDRTYLFGLPEVVVLACLLISS